MKIEEKVKDCLRNNGRALLIDSQGNILCSYSCFKTEVPCELLNREICEVFGHTSASSGFKPVTYYGCNYKCRSKVSR